jgi:hypothetical protein
MTCPPSVELLGFASVLAKGFLPIRQIQLLLESSMRMSQPQEVLRIL